MLESKYMSESNSITDTDTTMSAPTTTDTTGTMTDTSGRSDTLRQRP